MNILGINAYHGNASAAIVCEGRLVAAVEEERFNRVKYAAGFPAQAIRYCLKEAGLELKDIDHVAVPRNPYARLGTKLFYAMRMPSFARERMKVLAKFTGIPEALAQAFDTDPAKVTRKVSPRGASPGTSRQRVLRFSVRTSGVAFRRRPWRFREHDVGQRQR